MNLYIVRHGKTEWNKLGLVQGKTNIPLSNEGKKELEKTKQKLKDIKFDICFSSPLFRAIETAEFLVGDVTPITIDERLTERGCGILEGKPIDFDLINASWKLDGVNPIPESEDVESILKRTKDFLDMIKKEKFENVLIVSHGGTIKALHYNIIGYDENTDFSFYSNNGHINKYEI